MGFSSKIGFTVVVGLAVAVAFLALGMKLTSSSDLREQDVAHVGDEHLTVSDYEKLARVVNGSRSSGKPATFAPDPPNFTKCAAEQARTNRDENHAALVNQCRSDFERTNPVVMNTLIRQRWYEIYAKDHSVKVSNAAIQKQFEETLKSRFKNETGFREYLRISGLTMPEVLATVRAQLILEAVQKRVENYVSVSEKEVESKFKSRPQGYDSREKVDAEMVFTRDRASAVAARNAVESGQPWPTVAKKYMVSGPIQSPGGLVLQIDKTLFVPALSKRLFSAKPGVVVGPVSVAKGYYVFRVRKTHAPRKLTVKELNSTLRSNLLTTKRAAAWKKFQHDFDVEWRSKTDCADDYKVELCKNGPQLSEAQ